MKYYNFVLGILITVILFSTGISLGESNQSIDELIEKGNEHFRLGQYEEALPYFEKVLEIEPTNIDALKSKSFILFVSGEFEEASSFLDKVLEIEPNDRNSLNLKIMVLGTIDPEEAGKYALKIAELNAKIQSFLLKAEEHYLRSELEDALSYFNNALELDPKHIVALKGKAVTLYELGEFYDSFESITKAIDQDPTNPELARIKTQMVYSLPRESHPEGSLKLLMRDSKGGLIGYQEVFGFGILLHEQTDIFLDLWEVKKDLTQEGQNYEIIQLSGEGNIEDSSPFAQAFISTTFNGTTLPNMFTLTHGVPFQKGGIVYELWTMVRPID